MRAISKRSSSIVGILLVVLVVLIAAIIDMPRMTTQSKFNIINWWWHFESTNQGLEALTESFRTAHPGIEIYDSTMGSMFPEQMLKTGMDTGNPPDSFQTNVGRELINDWAAKGYLEPVTFIFEENDWRDKYHPGLLDLVSYDGQIWGVPIGVDRTVLWYNKAIFAQYNLEPPKTWDDFFAAAETLKAAGITPLAAYSQFTLFEAVLLSSLGPEKYRGFLNGNTDWSEPLVAEALNTLSRIYANKNHADLRIENAIHLMADGKVAMVMASEGEATYLPPKAEIGLAPTPGAQGAFIISASAFVLPKKAHHRNLTIDWLTLCGSQEGQDTFSTIGGRLPARTDANQALYNEYYRSILPDWASSQVVPSLWIAMNNSQVNIIYDVLRYFVAHRNIETAQQGLVQASGEKEIPAVVLHKAITERYTLAIDGSTSTIPLDQILACNLIGIPCTWSSSKSESTVLKFIPDPDASIPETVSRRVSDIGHSGTHEAYISLINSLAEIILVAREPSADELALAQKKGVQLDVQAVALDAFVFLVNTDNPIDNLTVEQIVDIYTGKITTWEELGIHIDPQSTSPEAIHAYQRERNSGSQELMEKLVMRGKPMIEAPNMIALSMTGPFNAIGGGSWTGGGDTLGIGYSIYYYTTYMFPHKYVKMVQVNGIAPTTENIATRSYPLTAEVYVVVQKGLPADEPALLLRDWLLSEEGQRAVEQSGYVPLR